MRGWVSGRLGFVAYIVGVVVCGLVLSLALERASWVLGLIGIVLAMGLIGWMVRAMGRQDGST
jgi:hypothetical protein